MTTLWIVPLLVAAVGLVLVAVSARRVADEASDLREAFHRAGELRPALVEIHTAARALRRSR